MEEAATAGHVERISRPMNRSYQVISMMLDEVSSLHYESYRDNVFTVFDFVAGDIRQRWFRVPGRHEIRPGMRVTAVLGEPENWQTLQAWRFDGQNKVVISISPVAGLIYHRRGIGGHTN